MYDENTVTNVAETFANPTEAFEIPALPLITEVIEHLEKNEPIESFETENAETPMVEKPAMQSDAPANISQNLEKPINASEPQKPTSKGIESLEELKNFEVLRTEFATSVFKPKVILSYETISFNKACLKLLPSTKYVNVLIDRHKKRIIILPVTKHAKDALQWRTNSPNGDAKRRVCTAKKFGEKLYDMMQWVKEYKYRVIAYYQEIEGVHLLVFNLCEYEMVVPEFVTTKTGKVVKRGKVFLPDSWQNGFGMPKTEHNEANVVELNAHYTLSDKDLDVTISNGRIQGKAPTDEEIIMSQYRKEKTQEVLVNV